MDSFGEEAKAALEKEMINTAHVAMDPASASGIALIVIDDAGENSIVVAPGSNGRLEAEDIYRAEDIVLSADMVLFQLEVPVDTVIAGIRFAVECGRKVMLNPAPAAPLPAELFPLVHIITPNQSEAFALTGVTVLDIQTAQAACDILHQRGVKSVVITMAEQGAYLSTNEERLMVPGFKAGEVVDTVAAGDTFCGALAVALAEGKTWKPALQFANAAAALSVTRRGAQASIPHREEVEWLLRSI
jgi:ribokinase